MLTLPAWVCVVLIAKADADVGAGGLKAIGDVDGR